MKLNVLIVEDEQLMRQEIVQTTPWEQFSCVVVGQAENGVMGEEMILSLKPDLVITDIRMPGQDGMTMLENTNPPAAIILTGFSDFEFAKKAIRLGVRDYILKPIDTKDFHAALEKICKEIHQKKYAQPLPAFQEYVVPIHTDKQDFYIECAISYIKKNYHKDISLRDASGCIGITESYLSRLFKQKTGYTFLEYLRNHRLKIALELMKDRTVRINEVARKTGFRDMSYFSEVFRKHVGMSPTRFLNGFKTSSSQRPESVLPAIEANPETQKI